MKSTTRSSITRILKWTAVLLVLLGLSLFLGFLVSMMDSVWKEGINKQKLFYAMASLFTLSNLIIMGFAWKLEENYWGTVSGITIAFCFNIPAALFWGIAGIVMAYFSETVWWQKPLVF